MLYRVPLIQGHGAQGSGPTAISDERYGPERRIYKRSNALRFSNLRVIIFTPFSFPQPSMQAGGEIHEIEAVSKRKTCGFQAAKNSSR